MNISIVRSIVSSHKKHMKIETVRKQINETNEQLYHAIMSFDCNCITNQHLAFIKMLHTRLVRLRKLHKRKLK